MNPERIGIYYDLMNNGIDLQSISAFPGEPHRFCKLNSRCYMLETVCGKYALWLVSEEEPLFLARLKLLRVLEDEAIKGFLFPVQLKTNRFYHVLEDGRLFYITKWPELRRISFRNDLESLLKLAIDFRKVMSLHELSFLKFKEQPKMLIDKYHDMLNSIKNFAMLANYRLHPTRFDRLFLECWEEVYQEAGQALDLIRSSPYLDLIGTKEFIQPIINDFSRSNLRTLPNDQAICISLKKSVPDLAIIDLALLMVKTGRANRWSRDWYNKIIEVYNKSFPLTDEELEITRAYLAFPWELYRLASRYYHNRVNWPVSVFVEKLERILKSDRERKDLLLDLY